MQMQSTSSTFSRRVINLLAGMAYGVPGLPTILSDLGYSCHAIEPRFVVGEDREEVNPEILLCSLLENHTILGEAKSGKNIDCDQLARYSKVTESALTREAFVPFGAGGTHDCVYVGLLENLDRNLIGLRKVEGVPLVLLCVDAQGMSVKLGGFSNKNLSDAFTDHLQVDWNNVPFAFLPLDAESTDSEYAQIGMPELIGKILSEIELLSSEELMAACIPEWSRIHHRYRSQMSKRMTSVISYAAASSFRGYVSLSDQSTKQRKFWKLAIPDPASNIKRVDPAIALHSALRALIEELADGQQIIQFPPSQGGAGNPAA